jgi:glycosyltransferase involved in cell wall biosynthesis
MLDRSAGISVIIPNYNRADALPTTLTALATQSLSPATFEVILVDDGSTDGTIALMERMREELPFAVQVLSQDHRGPGAARNRGAQAAQYELLLFLDSDIVADSRLLETHHKLQAGAQNRIVAGARRTWPQACGSLFMQVMKCQALDQDQFTGRIPSIFEVFTANLSIRRDAFWRLHGFDQALWAYEDVDLACRAEKTGMQIVASSEALGFHNHPLSLDQACQQQRSYQRHAVRFLQKHPELRGRIAYLSDKEPVKLFDEPLRLTASKVARQILASRLVLPLLRQCVRFVERWAPNPGALRFLYWKVISCHQLIGYREGLKLMARSTN